MKVRRAVISDLETLVEFASAEARESENSEKIPATVSEGIRKALEDESIAFYWVIVDDNNNVIGNISALREWSDWHAGFYWWIQSMYLVPSQRGKGYIQLMLNAVKDEMQKQGGLELRLYVHNENATAIKAYTKSGFVNSPYKIMVSTN